MFIFSCVDIQLSQLHLLKTILYQVDCLGTLVENKLTINTKKFFLDSQLSSIVYGFICLTFYKGLAFTLTVTL